MPVLAPCRMLPRLPQQCNREELEQITNELTRYQSLSFGGMQTSPARSPSSSRTGTRRPPSPGTSPARIPTLHAAFTFTSSVTTPMAVSQLGLTVRSQLHSALLALRSPKGRKHQLSSQAAARLTISFLQLIPTAPLTAPPPMMCATWATWATSKLMRRAIPWGPSLIG
jgi:hypothetical protein